MSTSPTRRQFLARAAILAAAAPTLPAYLAACSKSGPSSGQPSLTLASPDNPVKWPIPDDNNQLYRLRLLTRQKSLAPRFDGSALVRVIDSLLDAATRNSNRKDGR